MMVDNKMSFCLHSRGKHLNITIPYNSLFAIGYAGRNIEKTMEHIRELEKHLGVPAPKKIPTIFQCSNLLLTQEEEFHVVGAKTCGEAEYVIILHNGSIYIGLGSDHTDRQLKDRAYPRQSRYVPNQSAPTYGSMRKLKTTSMRSRSVPTRQSAVRKSTTKRAV